MTLLQNWLKRGDVTALFRVALIVGSAAMAVALLAYAYLGTFTRYLADDYCNAYQFASGNFVDSFIKRYLATPGGNRYSNILFIWLSEIIGLKSVTILPAIMIILWTVGLFWLLEQARKTFFINVSVLVHIFLAVSIVFLSVFQAPNRYQTIYWRSGMATHFAPIVFMAFLVAFVMQQIRGAVGHRSTWWVNLICLVFAFLVGGFSEPPDAMLITALILAILGVWWRGKGLVRQSVQVTLIWTLCGALLALIVMVFSPANQLRLGTPPPDFIILVERSLRYTLEFIWDSIKTLRIPTFISVLLPMLVFWGMHSDPDLGLLSKTQRGRLWLGMAFAPLVMYLLIASSFAPSVYGQSYPVERTRFLGRFIMTVTLMLEGAFLGVLAAQFRPKAIKPAFISGLTAILLITLALYPLRAAWQTTSLIPEYRERAAAWDARDAQIRAYKAQGVLNIEVEELYGIDGIKELDLNARHWVNRCAAHYYGVDTIIAQPGAK